jgi:hypothetical protein
MKIFRDLEDFKQRLFSDCEQKVTSNESILNEKNSTLIWHITQELSWALKFSPVYNNSPETENK